MEENRRAKAAKEEQDEVRFYLFLIFFFTHFYISFFMQFDSNIFFLHIFTFNF